MGMNAVSDAPPSARPEQSVWRSDTWSHLPLAQSIACFQTRLLYRSLSTAMAGSVAAIVLCAYLFGARAARPGLAAAWVVAMLVVQLIRFGLYLHVRRHGFGPERARFWARIWAACSMTAGLGWGLMSWLFFPGLSDLDQMLGIVIIVGVVAIAIPITASHLPSLYGFSGLCLLPMVVYFGVYGRPGTSWITVILILFLMTALGLGERIHLQVAAMVTSRRRSEQLAAELQRQNVELAHARTLAERASRAKSGYLAAASHDLGQPLHALALLAGALHERAHDAETRQITQSMDTSVRSLRAMLDDLLALSRLDAHKVDPVCERIALDGLCRQIVQELMPQATAKGLSVRVRVRPWQVRSDRRMLERIVRNLLINAIQHTDRGGVLLAMRPRGDEVSLEIWDTGCGIPTEAYERIFDEFTQLPPVRGLRSSPGLGLGLAIVKRLARLLAHPVGVRSRLGRGSVFCLRLPRSGTLEPAEAPAAADSLAGRVVVVFEDDVATQKAMRVLLEDWGMRPVFATRLAEVRVALERLGTIPDLIIADRHLGPGSSGPEMARSLRSLYGSQLPVIVVTGFAHDPQTADDDADMPVLAKPVQPGKLRALVSRLLLGR
ncbi:MAG: hypothetical protein AMXMBFR6_01440 [Betaproteobacteria bacterium]